MSRKTRHLAMGLGVVLVWSACFVVISASRGDAPPGLYAGLRALLEANLEISTALPCRISVYEEGGKTRLATIKPTALIGLYPDPELKGVAQEVETTLVLIMDEAAR